MLFSGTGVLGGEPGLLQPGHGIFHQVWVTSVLLKHLTHPGKNPGMKIPGAFSKVGGDTAFDQFAIHLVPLVVNVQHRPDMSGNGQFFTHWGRHDHSTQFLSLTPHRIFLVFLENTVKFEGVNHPLAG